jgi:hypothetical protein
MLNANTTLHTKLHTPSRTEFADLVLETLEVVVIPAIFVSFSPAVRKHLGVKVNRKQNHVVLTTLSQHINAQQLRYNAAMNFSGVK